MRPLRTSSMMSEIFPTCSPSEDITLFPSSVAAAMMSGPGPSPIPPPAIFAPPRAPPCGLIEPMIYLHRKWCYSDAQAAYPNRRRQTCGHARTSRGRSCYLESEQPRRFPDLALRAIAPWAGWVLRRVGDEPVVVRLVWQCHSMCANRRNQLRWRYLVTDFAMYARPAFVDFCQHHGFSIRRRFQAQNAHGATRCAAFGYQRHRAR